MLFVYGGMVGFIFVALVAYDIYYAETYDFDEKHRLDKHRGNT